MKIDEGMSGCEHSEGINLSRRKGVFWLFYFATTVMGDNTVFSCSLQSRYVITARVRIAISIGITANLICLYF